jgi:hypothetical protein
MGLAYSSDRQVRMKRSLFARETCSSTFIFQRRMKEGQLARQVVDANPENTRLAPGWESATALDDYFKWLNSSHGDLSCGRKLLDTRYRNVTEKTSE